MLPRLLLLSMYVAAAPAQDRQDWHTLLDQVRLRVRDTIQRLPNYLCTQTTDRTQYQMNDARHLATCAELIAAGESGKLRPTTSDRLRLDVAVSSDGEMYSWVGESGFHYKSLRDLVKDGASSTGSFAAFLSSIFNSNAASFSYNGEKTENGRLLAEFQFQVPLEKSNYSFGYRAGDGQPGHLLTGYDGTFLVDPKSSDLVRLSIRIGELPNYTGSCQATNTLDYRRVSLHGADFLLPSEVRLRIIDTNGVESENRSVFSACHEFLGESAVSFDSSPDSSVSTDNKPVLPPPVLLAGRPFQVAITQDIDLASAAVGDPIKARLTSPILDSSSRMLVPAGSPVTGRIVELRRYYTPSHIWSIVFRLDTLSAGGTDQPFTGIVDAIGQRITASQGSKGTLRWSATPGRAAIEFAELKPNEVIKSGQELKWITVAPVAEAAKVESPGSLTPMPDKAAAFQLPELSGLPSPVASPTLVPADAQAPRAPRNLGFTEGAPGELPPGWRVPVQSAGSAQIRSTGCRLGPPCAVVLVPANAPATSFGNLMQSFDATPYRGKTVRLRAWLRVDPAGRNAHAQMWLRVDRENGQTGLFDNMKSRPVTSTKWIECEIHGRVDKDALLMNFGVMAFGQGPVWIDSVDFQVVDRSSGAER